MCVYALVCARVCRGTFCCRNFNWTLDPLETSTAMDLFTRLSHWIFSTRGVSLKLCTCKTMQWTIPASCYLASICSAMGSSVMQSNIRLTSVMWALTFNWQPGILLPGLSGIQTTNKTSATYHLLLRYCLNVVWPCNSSWANSQAGSPICCIIRQVWEPTKPFYDLKL